MKGINAKSTVFQVMYTCKFSSRENVPVIDPKFVTS